MDYFDIFNTISSRNLTGKVLKKADDDEELKESYVYNFILFIYT